MDDTYEVVVVHKDDDDKSMMYSSDRVYSEMKSE
jgi:hypothetical protein